MDIEFNILSDMSHQSFSDSQQWTNKNEKVHIALSVFMRLVNYVALFTKNSPSSVFFNYLNESKQDCTKYSDLNESYVYLLNTKIIDVKNEERVPTYRQMRTKYPLQRNSSSIPIIRN